MNWRGLARRALPYVIAATSGFLVAYLIVAFFIFPSEIVPEDAPVPNVVGMDFDVASRRLREAGFQPMAGEREFHLSAPQNTVLEQNPPAGTSDIRGARVVLTLSGGQQYAIIPPVTGMQREEAVEAIRGAGFTIGSVTQQASNAARGEVVATRPAGGARVLVPSRVDLVLSSGPSMLEVPMLVGENYTQARDRLEQLGLRVGRVDIDNLAFEAANTVLRQDPAPGTTVRANSRVNLTISGRTE